MNSGNEKKIFKQFLYNEELLFSQIEKQTKISSNLLSYFLKKLIKNNLLEKKKNKQYKLTNKGEKLIPFYTEIESLNPLVVILLTIVKDEKILLVKREKRPYNGLWSLISGRMLIDESISEAGKRIFEKKLRAKCKVNKINSVVHERFIAKEAKHAFVFFMIEVEPLEKTLEHSGLKWFSLKRIPKSKTIASDYWLIKNKLNKQVGVVEEILESKGKKIGFVTNIKKSI